ncbi:peptidase A4 family-domain-containing protein [Podospora didyma]|uniref:Peptidase A4 family-domain-containing protein n=1 Tax=Podospora didyma TaxID=330526 RepID=A0AAE0P4Q1_9PEZI|nr:peptidase A4 family-domain-containing protein [Podospora didyma]
MRSLIHSFAMVSVLAWSVGAELTFVATARQGGREVDRSDIKFSAIPPRQHRRHGPPYTNVNATSHADVNTRRDRDNVSYSGNWCGASQHSSTSEPISNVFAYFTAPDLTLRTETPAPQFAAAWVGIDGANCRKTLLQAGVTTIVNSNGGQSASAWWEWYPEAAYTINNLPVKPGDWLSVNITATTPTTAKIVISNVQRGYMMVLTITNGPKLCREDAEWIVEDFYDAKGQVAFASFSDVWFQEAQATTVNGKKIGIDGAAMVHLQDPDGDVVCTPWKYDNSIFVVSSH